MTSKCTEIQETVIKMKLHTSGAAVSCSYFEIINKKEVDLKVSGSPDESQ